MLVIALLSPPHDGPDCESHIESHGQTDEHHGPARHQASLPDPRLVVLHHLDSRHLNLLLLTEFSSAQLNSPPIEWPDRSVVVPHVKTVSSAEASQQVQLVLRDGSGLLEDSPGDDLVTAGGGERP